MPLTTTSTSRCAPRTPTAAWSRPLTPSPAATPPRRRRALTISTPHTHPSPARDRLALLAVAGQFFINGSTMASIVGRAPQMRDQMGISLTTFGVLLTVSSLGGLTASLLAGRIIHRAFTRRVLALGGVVMVGSLPIIGSAHSPWVWLAGLLAFKFADALVDISMNMQASWLSARRHAPVMNRLHGLWSVGMLAGGLGAVGANAAGVSPVLHLSLAAVVMVVALVAATMYLLPTDEDSHADTSPSDGSSEPQRGSRLAVVLLVLAGIFSMIAEMTGSSWATFRLTDDFGAPAAWGSVAFVAFAVGMATMRLAGDALQMRLGRTGLHRLSLVLTTVGFATATLVPVPVVSVAGFVLVGVGVASFMPKLYDDAARLPGRRGAGLGAMTAGMRVAALTTPVAVGWLAGTSLGVGGAVALLALPAMVGLALVTERKLTGRHSVT